MIYEPAAKPKVIGHMRPHCPKIVDALKEVGVWDWMDDDEQTAAVEQGEIWDTFAGNLLKGLLNCKIVELNR